MFGYFRFILSLMVVASHCQITVQGVNFGVSSVVIFYILAGYVTVKLFDKIFNNKKNSLKLYFCDRFLRIFPLYIYIFVLTVAFLYITQYGNPTFTVLKIINNLFIIPLNYGDILLDNRTIFTMKSFATIPAIPQAGSLGLELQAYLLLAFIVFFNKQFLKFLFGLLSLMIFVIAILQNNIYTYSFGYIYLPGTLFMFLVGISIYRSTSKENDLFDKYFFIFTYGAMILLLLYLGIQSKLMTNFIREELFGLLIGIPIIVWIHNNNSTLLGDKYFGELSYGIFLSHSLVLIIYEYLEVRGIFTINNFKFFYILFPSLVIAYSGIWLIEYRITKLRFKSNKGQV